MCEYQLIFTSVFEIWRIIGQIFGVDWGIPLFTHSFGLNT